MLYGTLRFCPKCGMQLDRHGGTAAREEHKCWQCKKVWVLVFGTPDHIVLKDELEEEEIT